MNSTNCSNSISSNSNSNYSTNSQFDSINSTFPDYRYSEKVAETDEHGLIQEEESTSVRLVEREQEFQEISTNPNFQDSQLILVQDESNLQFNKLKKKSSTFSLRNRIEEFTSPTLSSISTWASVNSGVTKNSLDPFTSTQFNSNTNPIQSSSSKFNFNNHENNKGIKSSKHNNKVNSSNSNSLRQNLKLGKKVGGKKLSRSSKLMTGFKKLFSHPVNVDGEKTRGKGKASERKEFNFDFSANDFKKVEKVKVGEVDLEEAESITRSSTLNSSQFDDFESQKYKSTKTISSYNSSYYEGSIQTIKSNVPAIISLKSRTKTLKQSSQVSNILNRSPRSAKKLIHRGRPVKRIGLIVDSTPTKKEYRYTSITPLIFTARTVDKVIVDGDKDSSMKDFKTVDLEVRSGDPEFSGENLHRQISFSTPTRVGISNRNPLSSLSLSSLSLSTPTDNENTILFESTPFNLTESNLFEHENSIESVTFSEGLSSFITKLESDNTRLEYEDEIEDDDRFEDALEEDEEVKYYENEEEELEVESTSSICLARVEKIFSSPTSPTFSTFRDFSNSSSPSSSFFINSPSSHSIESSTVSISTRIPPPVFKNSRIPISNSSFTSLNTTPSFIRRPLPTIPSTIVRIPLRTFSHEKK